MGFIQISRCKTGLMFSLLLLICFRPVFAGITGKVAGRVVDAGNGTPMPYVNVYIENTPLGSATDDDGNFVILNVSPGVYTVTASAIGYQNVSFTDVKVSIDLTTRLDFSLREAAVNLGETIVVEAERPLITKDLTASTAVVTSRDIQALPVTEFQEILALQAGMIDGHVRGGRRGEVVYAIDGIPITDTYDGSTVVDVNTNSIQELQFVSGAFNAEYGKALSGYVNIATKETNNTFGMGVTSYMGDYVSTHTDIFRAIDQVDPTSIRNIEGYVTGPIIKNKLSYYANVRFIHFGGWLNGRQTFNPWDITINKGPNEEPQNRYDIQHSGDGSIVSMNWNQKVYTHGKLSYKPFASLTLNYNFMMDRVKYRDYDHAFAYNPDGDFQRFREGITNIMGITHVLSQASFYQLNFSYFSKHYQHYVYEDVHDPRYTHYALLDQQPQDVPSFKTGGTQNQHFERRTTTATVKLDFTSQVNRVHQVKFGIDFSRHNLDYNTFSLLQQDGLQDPSVSGNPFVIMRVPDPDDPNENLSIDRYTRKPMELSAYLQDKIELNQLIINAGIRFDSFFPDGKVLSDPTDPDIYRPRRPDNIAKTLAERQTYWYQDASAKYQLSPRLGVSFPITETGVFHFSYGHFFQIPNFELLYQNPEFKFATGTGNRGIVGNSDLKPEQTINGEVGFSQALARDVSIDVTGYFRDIRNLAGTRADEIIMFGGSSSYSKIVNSDFGFVRGIVFTLDKRFSNSWSAKVDYTFQTAKGNASDPAATRNQIVGGQEPEIQLINLDFDQTHTVNATVNYASPKGWGFSLIGQYGSGMPYTPTQSIDVSKLLTNTEIKPAFYNVDLKAQKDFRFASYRFKLFLRVYNLFDIKNEINVYGDSGTADFTLEEYRKRLKNLPALVNTLDEYYRIPLFYSEPRRIEIGFSLGLQ